MSREKEYGSNGNSHRTAPTGSEISELSKEQIKLYIEIFNADKITLARKFFEEREAKKKAYAFIRKNKMFWKFKSFRRKLAH